MIGLCRSNPPSHRCFWLGIIDKRTQRMHRAFILGLPVMDMKERRIVGVEMRILHSGSILLKPAEHEQLDTEDLATVAKWMVLILQHVMTIFNVR